MTNLDDAIAHERTTHTAMLEASQAATTAWEDLQAARDELPAEKRLDAMRRRGDTWSTTYVAVCRQAYAEADRLPETDAHKNACDTARTAQATWLDARDNVIHQLDPTVLEIVEGWADARHIDRCHCC